MASTTAPVSGAAASRVALPPVRAGAERVLEIQRARLLSAATAVSAERGAANVTVAHIVERAGVSRRTFYELFEDREDCLLAAFDDALERVERAVRTADDPAARWSGRTRAAMASALACLDADRGAGLLLTVGALACGPQVLERRNRALARLVELVDRLRGESKAADEPPPLTAEGVVGGVVAIVGARLLGNEPQPLAELTSALTSMIVLPYLGAGAARRELLRPVPQPPPTLTSAGGDPLRELRMRLTYRTARVLGAVASTPGGSNREVADTAGIGDQGQISKLLARLQALGLIDNVSAGAARGAPNSWVLTDRGWELQGVLGAQGQ
jgi:AcrR family transcriptional regulator